MITHPKDQITTSQATMLVTNVIIATGIITLPRGVVKEVGNADGWISVILGGVLALFFGWVVGKLCQRFPEQSFYQYSEEVIGKFWGKLHSFLIIVFYLIGTGHQARIMGEVIRMFLLDHTPLEVTIIAFMCVGVYLTVGGINPIARICELFFPVILILLFIFIVFSFREFELINLRPVMGEGIMPVLQGMKATSLSYIGFEVMLITAFFMKEPQKAAKSILKGIAIVIPLYTLVVIIAIGTLTVEELQTVTWPMMSVAKSIELPGGFFERFEAIFVVLWIIAIFTTFIQFHYVASIGLGHLFKKDYHYFVYGVLPVIYIVAMYPKNVDSVFQLGEFVGYVGIYCSAIMPCCFWMIAKIRRKGLEKS